MKSLTQARVRFRPEFVLRALNWHTTRGGKSRRETDVSRPLVSCYRPRLACGSPLKIVLPARRARFQRVRAVARQHGFPALPRSGGSAVHRTLDLLGVAHHDGLVELAKRRRDIAPRLLLVLAAVFGVHRRRTSIGASFDDCSQGLYDDGLLCRRMRESPRQGYVNSGLDSEKKTKGRPNTSAKVLRRPHRVARVGVVFL